MSAGRYDRWRVVSIWSLQSTNFFFSAIKRKTRLSSKYAPRYCCATLVIFKAQHPVTAHVPNFAFLTGCREFRRCEESKRALKNPFASRLAEFDTTLNVRGTQGSLKKWSESHNKCEKSGKKAEYVVFCFEVTRQLGNVFKELKT